MTILVTVGAILLIAVIDANGKGRMMARYGWKALPDFWRDQGAWCWRSVLAMLVLLECWILFWCYGWRPVAGLLFMAGCGVESCLYWWLLRPFGIKQVAWWREGSPAARWLDYPPEAPWLRVLPGFWIGRISRRRVYVTALLGLVGASIICSLA